MRREVWLRLIWTQNSSYRHNPVTLLTPRNCHLKSRSCKALLIIINLTRKRSYFYVGTWLSIVHAFSHFILPLMVWDRDNHLHVTRQKQNKIKQKHRKIIWFIHAHKANNFTPLICDECIYLNGLSEEGHMSWFALVSPSLYLLSRCNINCVSSFHLQKCPLWMINYTSPKA